MIDQAELVTLVRDALSKLYDYAALETHPLANLLPRLPGYSGRRADYLGAVLLQAIEALKPPAGESGPGSVEWRPYLILHGRYVERIELRQLQRQLAVSERQLRREHSRAVQAVAAILWDSFFLKRADDVNAEMENLLPDQWGSRFGAFAVTHEPLDIAEVVRGVAETLKLRLQEEGTSLSFSIPPETARPLADRIVLRQVLLSLLSYALDVSCGGEIMVGADQQADSIILWIQFQAGSRALPTFDAIEDKEIAGGVACYWARRLGARLQVIDLGNPPGSLRLSLSLPLADRPVLMVVDDQAAAVRMFQRYLARSGIRVIGVQDPRQVVPLACQLRPRAITLDVMMPTMDGWELLQALQANPETCHIPVVVCSVWNEPELAFSLGAAGFLKKPITQKDLLGMLARLGVLDTSDVRSPKDSSESGPVHGERVDGAS